MDEQKLDDQLETIYKTCMTMQDIVLKTSWEGLAIETSGERGPGRSMLAERHDYYDIYIIIIYIYIYIRFIYLIPWNLV